MPIKISCANCGATYELDNAMGGRDLACSCGENLKVPMPQQESTASSPTESKSCPNCGSVVTAESLICVQCGFNFATGKKLTPREADAEDSPEEPPESFLQKYSSLIKLAVIATVALAATLLIYIAVTSKHYGISGKAPLGAFTKIDRVLQDVRLAKGKEPDQSPKGFGAEAKIYRYVDKDLLEKSHGMFSEEVFVVVDSAGKVCAVGGSFSPPSEAIPGSGTKVQRFITYFWEEAGCPPSPEFKEVKRQNDFFSWTENAAEFTDDKLAAKWAKGQAATGLQASSDHVWIVLKGLSIDALEQKEGGTEKPAIRLPQLPAASSKNEE